MAPFAVEPVQNGTVKHTNNQDYEVPDRPHSDPDKIRVICIGAGFSGLCLAYKMKQSMSNCELVCYETNSSVGGTWLENRYPGCACDIPAHVHSFSFEPNPFWSTFYAYAPEIHRYMLDFQEKYGLTDYIKLSSRVTSAVWDSERGEYDVEIETPNGLLKDKCHVLINASGVLNKWKLSIEQYGTPPQNPRTQAEGTVMFRLFVQAPERQAIAKFKRAIFFNGQAGYCGMHLGMDWRTLEPRPYVKYFPAVIQQVDLEVHFVGENASIKVPQTHEALSSTPALRQDNYETANPVQLSVYGDTTRAPLGDLVFARSGDKGGNANIGLWVRNAAAYPWLQAFMTVPRIIDLLGDDWSAKYSVHRSELPHLHAVHFLVYGILQEGVSSSSIIDSLAKSFAEFIRARHVDLPTKLLEQERDLRRSKQADATLKRESLEP